MRKLAHVSGCILLFGVALPACGEGDADGGSNSGSSSEHGAARGPSPAVRAVVSSSSRAGGRPTGRRSRTRPSIRILRPIHGQRIPADEVTVTVTVDNFRIVQQRVRPPFPPAAAGRGHVHFYLDTQGLPTTHGRPTTGTYRSLSAKSHTWVGVTPGRHSLAVQLVGKDHAPLDPQAKDRITVDVG